MLTYAGFFALKNIKDAISDFSRIIIDNSHTCIAIYTVKEE